jgi:hypothetical protein
MSQAPTINPNQQKKQTVSLVVIVNEFNKSIPNSVIPDLLLSFSLICVCFSAKRNSAVEIYMSDPNVSRRTLNRLESIKSIKERTEDDDALE